MPQPFSLLIKPASADCNLRCSYCFYLDHAGFYPETPRHRMSDEVLAAMVRGYMATTQPTYQFGWQGGEPTLLGVDFFRRAVQYQQRFGRSGASVANGLQTNATLITDDLAALLAEYRFLTGVSLDGPAWLHDRHRQTADGRGSHADVLAGIRRLEARHAEFNLLVLVSAANVREPAAVYHYLCEHGWLYHQYIPCVEPDERRRLLPFSISAEAWGEFLCRLFDGWYAADSRRVSIRLFDSVLALLVDGVRTICPFGSNCCQYFVVEYNGDVFPCDFFVEKRLCLGNVRTDALEPLQQSPLYRSFGEQKTRWHADCESCAWQWMCQGDCLKHRLCVAGGEPRQLSRLCAGWRLFFEHTMGRFRSLAAAVTDERRRAATRRATQAPGRDPGRNDPCPCGSGHKYKHCCWS
jgi:uncharacterized protein